MTDATSSATIIGAVLSNSNVNTIVNFLTLVVVAIYAGITYKLWKEAAKQSKQNLMPLPVVYKKRTRDNHNRLVDKFVVKNIGNGPALNVHVEKFTLRLLDNKWNIDETHAMTFKLNEPNVLDKNEERQLIPELLHVEGDHGKLADLSPYIDPDYAEIETPLTLSYQDIVGITYKITILFGKGKLRIVDPPKEMRARGHIV